jgi:hypothetical protein
MIDNLKKLIFISVTFLLFSLHSASLALANQNESLELLDKKVTLVLNHFDEELVLRTLAMRAKVAIGFEAICKNTGTKEARTININVKKGTVRDVLDAFIKENPRYRWELVNGIINVLPRESQDSILEIMVHNFNLSNMNVDELSLAIADLPEISAKLNKMKVSPAKVLVDTGEPKETPRFSITLQDLTLREILNELLRKGHSNYWAVERYGTNNEYIRFRL